MVQRLFSPFVLISLAPALGGCVPMMAASAATTVITASQPKPVSNEALKPQAQQACSAEAARYGTIHIIDVEQAKVNKIIVWGTVDDGTEKKSFQCDFGNRITGFKLRPIRP